MTGVLATARSTRWPLIPLWRWRAWNPAGQRMSGWAWGWESCREKVNVAVDILGEPR